METTTTYAAMKSPQMRARAAEGRHVNRTPLGYRRDGVHPDPAPDELAAPLVHEAFETIASGMSLRKALRELTANGSATAGADRPALRR
jgi:hypothetical protein